MFPPPTSADLFTTRKNHEAKTLLTFEVPFLPDAEYIDFLAENQAHLASVYFSLHDPHCFDARVGVPSHPLSRLIQDLKHLPGVTKYALLNSRFHPPQNTLDAHRIDAVLDTLETLVQAGCLQGIVYVDHYLLRALSDRNPDLCARLQAVPGVNCLLDSLPRIAHHLECLEQTAFKAPEKIVLDRSLNRDRKALDRIASQSRQLWPNMHLGLLANEGCLPHCPFKLAHDSSIALGRMDPAQEQTRAMNTSLGCARSFVHDPSLLLRSPFLRPEDIHAYAPSIQHIKLSGRTRGARIMRRVIDHYIHRAYSGNLLELMDTQELLADRFVISNQDLPSDFGQRTMNCALACYACSYCRDLAKRHVQDKGVRIKPMWA